MGPSEWLRGNGESAALIRSKDWSASPLGPRDGWSPALRTAVNLVIDSPRAMALVWGATGTLLYNDRFGQILGSRHPALLGQSAAAQSHELATACQAVLAGASTAPSPLGGSLCPVRDEAGIIGGALLEVARADALEESRAKLHAALASMSDSVFISDTEGRIVDVNDAFLAFHRFRSRQELPSTLAEYGTVLDLSLPDGSPVPEDMWPVTRALRGESVMDAEYQLRRRDTGEVWIGSYNFAPVRNDGGPIVGTVVVGRDVTQRKRAEDALRESEQRYVTLFAESPVATAVTRLSDQVRVSANAAFAKLFELGPDELVGVRSVDQGLVDPEVMVETLKAIAEHGAQRDVERTLRTRTGRTFTAIVDNVTLTLGGEDHLLTTTRDVTAQRAAEEAARLYERARSHLADLAPLERLGRVSARLVRDDDPVALLTEILEAAVEITGADFGALQTVEPSGDLRTAVQRGLPPAWLAFWDGSSRARGARDAAVARGERVIIDDVATGDGLDEAARAVHLEAGIRAVQSTPLVSRGGAPLGVISTYGRRAYRPDDHALGFLDLLARQAADFLERLQRGQALQRSEALASGILMTSVDGIICIDAEHRILRFNASAEQIFGYAAAEMIGQPLDALLPERIRPAHGRHVETFASRPPGARTMGERPATIVGRRKTGEEFPVEVSISKVEIGPEVVLTATIRDVTEARRQAERLHFLVNESPAVLYVCEMERPFSTTFVGANVLDQFGYRPEQLTSEPGFWWTRINPDDVGRIERSLAQISGTRALELEYRILKADGSYGWVHDEVTLSTNAHTGEPELIGFLTDITTRKSLEAFEARTRAEDHVLAKLGAALDPLDYERSLARATECVVRELGELGSLFLVHEGSLRRATGASIASAKMGPVERLAREPIHDLVPSIVLRCFAEKRAIIDRAVGASDRQILTDPRLGSDPEIAALLRDAPSRHALVVPLLVEDRCIGVLATSSGTRIYGAQDLVLAEEVARRLAAFVENAHLRASERRATRLRDDVLGVVAHDLRSPLNAIVLQSQRLARHGARDAAEAIGRSTKRMNRLIEDLLDVARMEAGRLRVDRSPVSPGRVATEVVEAHAALATELDVQLRLELGADLPDVWADRDRLLQVFENLVGNAMKFTNTDGIVTVRATRRDATVLCSVADTGRGIAAENLPRIFDRFWQGQDGHRGGAGLGLAICKAIIEALDGQIWVESELGRGTTFFFSLPVVEARREPQGVPAISYTRLVLVAEDDPDQRAALATLLRDNGYHVVGVPHGEAALARLRVDPRPALLILDLSMPVLDGWGVLAARERDAELRAVPVIVVSAEPGVAARVAAAHATFLAKPVVADRLLAAIEAARRGERAPRA